VILCCIRRSSILLKLAFVTLIIAAGLRGAFADRPFPPHKIADNLYYVGSEQLASYLITTPDGDILINTSLEQTVPLIKASVEKLGFHFKDIRILLISHAHFDHCESLATVKAMTGAKVYIMKGDDDVVRSGGKGAVGGDHPWKPVAVDRVLSDGDTVALGGIVLTAHLTPGHTKGCTTWTMVTRDESRKLNVAIVGSPNVNPGYRLVKNRTYPEIADDYKRMFAVLKSLPCDIFLGAHGSYYGMEQKYSELKSGGSNPFVDSAGYQNFVEAKRIEFETELRRQTNAHPVR
jgi:metallo-beta-lactamase class B